MSNKTSFQSVIDALLDTGKPFPASYLQMFSDLPAADVSLLKKAWGQVIPIRKQTLLEDLRDLAETDLLTNFDTIGQAFLDDLDPAVRIQSIRLLWQCEEQALIPIFMSMLQQDASAEVRAAAASALGLFVYLGELEELKAATVDEIDNALLEAASSEPSSLVKRAALEAIGASSRPEVPELIENAVHQKEPEWVVSALAAMGHSSDETWEKHILARLRHANDDIRWAAIEAAGEIGLPTARQALLDMLEDEEDVEIRHTLIQALSKIGGDGVRPALQELLDMEDDEEELEFMEDALETLILTEGTGLDMFDIDPDIELDEPPDHKNLS